MKPLGALIALGLLSGGCQMGGAEPLPSAPGAAVAQAVPWQPAATLPEGRWRVVRLGDEALGEEAGIDLGFADGVVAGSSGCNRFSGPARLLAGGRLALGPMAATMMACDEAGRMERERRFLDLLGKAERLEQAPGLLAIVSAEGTRILAEPARPPQR